MKWEKTGMMLSIAVIVLLVMIEYTYVRGGAQSGDGRVVVDVHSSIIPVSTLVEMPSMQLAMEAKERNDEARLQQLSKSTKENDGAKEEDNQVVVVEDGQYDESRYLSPGFVRTILEKYDWGVDLMLHIIYEHETHSGDIFAYNPDGPYYGLLQISTDYLSPEDLYNPYYNIKVGYEQKFLTQGYGAWGH